MNDFEQERVHQDAAEAAEPMPSALDTPQVSVDEPQSGSARRRLRDGAPHGAPGGADALSAARAAPGGADALSAARAAPGGADALSAAPAAPDAFDALSAAHPAAAEPGGFPGSPAAPDAFDAFSAAHTAGDDASWRVGPGAPAAHEWDGAPRNATLRELLAPRSLPWAAAIVLVLALIGVGVAYVWSALGPHVNVLMTDQGPSLGDTDTETFAAVDVRYAWLTGLVGLLSAAIVWRIKRWRGPLLVVALALGNLAGAWITSKVGPSLGRETYNHLLDHAAVGRTFDQPAKVRAEGLIFLQAIAGVTVYMVLAAWSHFPDLGAFSSSPSEPEAEPAEPARPVAGTASSPPA